MLIVAEAKPDSSSPTAQLLIQGFRLPFQLDINSRSGG